jgi:hypothetical protein
MDVEIGLTYHSNVSIRLPILPISNKDIWYIDVALHSYMNENDAISIAKLKYDLGVAKCIIPIGAIYYEGDFRRFKSYASSELRYESLIYTPAFAYNKCKFCKWNDVPPSYIGNPCDPFINGTCNKYEEKTN